MKIEGSPHSIFTVHMHIKRRFPSNIPSESFLLGILHLIGLLSLYRDDDKRGRPYVYPTTVILRCYVVRIWFRIPSNNALHYFLSINTNHKNKIMSACGLHQLPDRRTFDRRFKILPVQNIIGIMGQRFLKEGIVERNTAVADSAIIPCKKVWHKSDIKQTAYRHPESIPMPDGEDSIEARYTTRAYFKLFWTR
jgi:hypothetical protein